MSVLERRKWKDKKLLEMYARIRNIRTSLLGLSVPNEETGRTKSYMKHKNVSLRKIYSFPDGKLQLSLAKPDKDKYDTHDKKQHNLQKLIKQPGPA